MEGAVAVETLMENFPVKNCCLAEKTRHHGIDKPRNNTITSYLSQLPRKETPTSPQLHHMDLLKYFSPRPGLSSKSQECLVEQKDSRGKTSKHVNAVLSKSGERIKHNDQEHKVKTKRKKKELELEIIELETTQSLDVLEERKVTKTEKKNIRKNERCILELTEERQQPVRMSGDRGCSEQKSSTNILGRKAQRGNADIQSSSVMEEKGLKHSIEEPTKKVSNEKKRRAKKKELSVLSVEKMKSELNSSADFDDKKPRYDRERSKVRTRKGSLSGGVQGTKIARTAPSLEEFNASVGSNDQSNGSNSTKKEKSEFMAAFRRLSNSSSQEPPLHARLQRPRKKQCKSTTEGEQEGRSCRKVPQRTGITMRLLGQQESKEREHEKLIIDEGSINQEHDLDEGEVMGEKEDAEIEEVIEIKVCTKLKGEEMGRKKDCGKYKEGLKGKSKDESQSVLTIDNITFCKKTHKEGENVNKLIKPFTKKDTKAQSKKCIRKSCVVKAQPVKPCNAKRRRQAQQNVDSTERVQEQVRETDARRQNLRKAIRKKRKQILIRSLYRSEQLEAEEAKKGSPIRLKISRVVPSSTPEDKSDIKRVGKKELTTMLKHRRLGRGERRTSQDRVEQAPLSDSSQDFRAARRKTQMSTVILIDASPKRFGRNLRSKRFGRNVFSPRTKMTRSCKSLLNEFCSTRKATATEAKPGAEAALKLAPIFQPRILTPVLGVKALDSDGIIQVKGVCPAQRQPFLQCVPTKQAACAMARVAPTANLPAFLPVVHVLQKDGKVSVSDSHHSKDSSCWDMPFPTSLQFCRSTSEPVPVIIPSTTLSLGQLTWAKISSCRESHALWAGQCIRTDIQSQALLEEIKATQPGFSVNRFYRRLLSKRFSDSSAGFKHSTMEGIKGHQGSTNCLGFQGKRKAEERSNRYCRRKRRRQEMEEKTVKDTQSETVMSASGRSNSEAVRMLEHGRTRVRKHCGDALRHAMSTAESFDTSGYDIAEEEVSKRTFESVDTQLWTDRYQPKESKEVVGNTGAISRLYSWLKEWKQHVSKEAKRDRRGKKEAKQPVSNKQGHSNSKLESQSDTESSMTTDSDIDDGLCSAALLCGPPGVGKTAAVYACAQELGYKVFEVNCSSLRSGRILVSQLQEATQSHQIHKTKSYGQPFTGLSKGCEQATGDGSGTQKHTSPKKMSPPPRKNLLLHHPQASLKQTRQRAKPPSKSQIPAAFANFVKSQPPLPQKMKNERSIGAQSVTTPVTARSSSTKATQAKYSATTSLILFEEVDVTFDDDIGFLSAIKTFMTTTKRPIVLTTNDPKFCNVFEGHYEQILFERPSMFSATAFLRLVCLAEGLHTRCDHVDSLVAWTRCDLRRSLLSLQIWAAAGGGTKLPTADRLENTLQQEDDVLRAAPNVLVGEESGASCVESTRSVCALCVESSSFGMQLSSVLGPSGFCRQVSSLTELQRLGLDIIQDHWPLLMNFSGSRHLHDLPPVSENIASDGKTSPRCLKMGIGRLSEPDVQAGLQIEDDGSGDLLDRSSLGILDDGEDKAKLDNDRSFSKKPLENTTLICLEYLTDLLEMFSTIDGWPPGQGVKELEGPCRHGNGYDWLPAEVKSGQMETVRVEEGKDGWAQPWKEWPELRATMELEALQQCRDKTARALKLCEGHGLDIVTNAGFQDFEISRFITEASEEQRRLGQRHSLLQDALLRLVSPAALGARHAVATETTPYLRFLCRMEKKREAAGSRRRFRHYLEERLDVPRTLLKFLDADFP